MALVLLTVFAKIKKNNFEEVYGKLFLKRRQKILLPHKKFYVCNTVLITGAIVDIRKVHHRRY